jgi:hypothetical protein
VILIDARSDTPKNFKNVRGHKNQEKRRDSLIQKISAKVSKVVWKISPLSSLTHEWNKLVTDGSTLKKMMESIDQELLLRVTVKYLERIH